MPYTPNQRQKAFARAMKFQKLFWGDLFDNIVDATLLPKPQQKTAFEAAVKNEMWMTQEEKDWLWNYLQNCHKNFWGKDNVLEAAAGTGW